MSHTCQIVRGFFLQRLCGRKGTLSCQKCGKLFCSKHRARHIGSRTPLCVECGGEQAAGSTQTGEKPKPRWDRKDHQWEDDHYYPYYYRQRYHRHYAPLWLDDVDHDARHAHESWQNQETDFEKESPGLEDFEVEDGDNDISAFDS